MDTEAPGADYATLPAEIVCAILSRFDPGWWPLAARVCRWWRACVCAAMRVTPNSKASINIATWTLSLAVCGGHVSVVTWMEQASGRSYARARGMVEWMASALPDRSWDNVMIAAARDGRDDVLLWGGRHMRFAQGLSGGADIPVDVALLAAIACGRTRVVEDQCLGMPRMDDRVVYEARAVPCAVARGDPELLSLLLYACFPKQPSVVLLAALCANSHMIDDLCGPYETRCWMTGPFDDEATWLADQRLTNARDGDVRPDPSSPDEHSVFRTKRPPVRSPRPDDFLPGGALEAYAYEAEDPNATFGQVLASLLWPLCADPDYTTGDLDAWIKSALVDFRAWNVARVAARRPIRFNLAVTGTYNADFDGDSLLQ
ncbi:RNA polymerase rbp1 incomplete domain containing protein [Pandoravirus salinus]|uniref:RNA polymerase rbp1 incomplete domain containing protein n=1 Tax=Pandoravirus salinus TaxID=1349410 RepID=S4VUZ7_9VIRU|nr:RNA polymerase incomplete domain [Pandoravirus salinus]AGO84394.2 RNA polymerase rbp1 incomplete domain containing protein [Pandoravirus salinus]